MLKSDVRVGERVAFHPASNMWMRGARYGEVVVVGRIWVHVKIDSLVGFGKIVKVAPKNIDPITPWKPLTYGPT